MNLWMATRARARRATTCPANRRRLRRSGGVAGSPGPGPTAPLSATWRPSGSGGTSSTAASASSGPPCPRCPGWTRLKASLLADAATYIGELRDRVEQLEAEAKQASAAVTTAVAAASHSFAPLQEKLGLEVRMVAGLDAAALRLTTSAARHAPAHLMLALRSLDLQVQHACVCRVGGVTVQDAIVDVPAGLRDERCLRAALLQRLQPSG